MNPHQHDSDNHTLTSVSRSHKAGSTMSRTQSLVRAPPSLPVRRRPSAGRALTAGWESPVTACDAGAVGQLTERY